MRQSSKEHSAWPWTSTQQEALKFHALPPTVPTSPISTSCQPAFAPVCAAVEAYPQQRMQALIETVELDMEAAPKAAGEHGLWEKVAKGNEEVLAALSALRESLCSQITTYCRQQLVQLRSDLEEQFNEQQGKLKATIANLQQENEHWRGVSEGTLQEDINILKRDVSRIMEHQDLTHEALQSAMVELRQECSSLCGKELQEDASNRSNGGASFSSTSNRFRLELEAETKQRCHDVSTLHHLLYKEVADLHKRLEVFASTRSASLSCPVGPRGASDSSAFASDGRASALNPPSGLPYQYTSPAWRAPVSMNLPIGGAGGSLFSSAAPPPPSGLVAGPSDTITRMRSVGVEAESSSPRVRGLSSCPVGCCQSASTQGAPGHLFKSRSTTSTTSTSVGGTSGGCSNSLASLALGAL